MSNITYSEGEIPNFSVTLTDGATDQFVRAYVYNYDKTLKETVDLTFSAHGEYIGTATSAYTHNSYTVVYEVFSDSGHTTLNQDYWITEDNLYITYQPTWGGGVSVSGRGGDIFIDVKKIADAVWEHAFPKKLLEILEFIKEKVLKIPESFVNVLDAIKEIVFPDIPPYPEFPEIPVPEKVDMKPMMDCIKELADKIDAIDFKRGEDYGASISEIIRLLEVLQKKNNNLEIYNIIQELKRNNIDIKEVKNLIKKL